MHELLNIFHVLGVRYIFHLFNVFLMGLNISLLLAAKEPFVETGERRLFRREINFIEVYHYRLGDGSLYRILDE